MGIFSVKRGKMAFDMDVHPGVMAVMLVGIYSSHIHAVIYHQDMRNIIREKCQCLIDCHVTGLIINRHH